MSYFPTQQDFAILRNKNKELFIKVELLNKNFKTIDELKGKLVSDDFSIDSESDIRKTYTVSFIVDNDKMLFGEDKIVWFDKYLKIYLGIKYSRDNQIHYYPLGIYTLNENTYEFDSTTSLLTLPCLDLMAEINGIRNGKLLASKMKIEKGNKIRDVMINTLTQFTTIKKYRIEDTGKEVPYDLEFDSNSTVYDIENSLKDLYAGYEIFFDDDTFVFQKIPTCNEDSIFLDYQTFQPLVISENRTSALSDIKNVVSVYGKCIDTEHYTDSVSGSSSQYTLNVSSITTSSLDSYIQIGFKANVTNSANATLRVNSMSYYPLVDSSGNSIKANQIIAGKTYVVKYNNGKFEFLGQYQIHGINKLYSEPLTAEQIKADKIRENCDNISYTIIPDSPFTIDKIGKIRETLSGEDYEKIYSDDLALQRAEYERWKRTNYKDTISLEMISIPWIDVNKKVEYQPFKTKQINQYIIKKISGSAMSGVINVEMIRFYPLYPFVES